MRKHAQQVPGPCRHINCLELLVATLAVNRMLQISQCSFSWTMPQQWHTSTTWGHSLEPTDRFGKGFMDVGPRQGYYPVSPTRIRDRTDWMICPRIFQAIKKTFGPLDVDLFASRLTYQMPCFFSWRPDPLAEAVDAFQQDWSSLKGLPTHHGA